MTLDDGLIEALRQDYRTAPITEQERVMLDFVVKLTKDATMFAEGSRGAARRGIRRSRDFADHADRGLV